jgi:branched-chain amino acid transport system substrate-binding protein
VSFRTRALTVSRPAGAGAAAASSAPLTQGGLLPAGARGAGTGARASGPGGGVNTGGGGAPIKIGTVLPLQGGERDFGEPVLRTTQAFIDELNARGGVNGHPLQLVAYSACLVCQDDALTAVRRLVEQDGVFAIVNTYVMVVAFQPVVPYLAQKGVPLIQGGAENQTSDALSPINFATAPSGLFYGRFLPKMVSTYAHVQKVAITYLNVPSEANGLPILRRELAREGVTVVDEEPVPAAEDAVTNMDSVAIRMRTRGATGVLATNPVLLIFGRLAAARQGWPVPWVGEAAWSQLVEDGCGTTCDDLVLTDTAGLSYTDRDSPQMHQYLDTMARRYPGGQISGHTLAAWVGMQLTVEALARLQTIDRGAFLRTMNQLANLDLGTTSPLTFSPDRHLGGSASILLKLKGGHYVRVSDPLNFGEAAG